MMNSLRGSILASVIAGGHYANTSPDCHIGKLMPDPCQYQTLVALTQRPLPANLQSTVTQ